MRPVSEIGGVLITLATLIDDKELSPEHRLLYKAMKESLEWALGVDAGFIHENLVEMNSTRTFCVN